jgi:hypothetical protein
MRLDTRGVYPPDWSAIAERVKQQAGHRCIRCGHPRGDRMIVTTKQHRELTPCTEHCTHPQDGKLRILTVHHLDGDKANCRWWNLLALCPVCHLTIQAKVIPERPYLWDHSRWFVPYVCGFYAHYYGQEDITRAEAEARPDYWLTLGQPWREGASA